MAGRMAAGVVFATVMAAAGAIVPMGKYRTMENIGMAKGMLMESNGDSRRYFPQRQDHFDGSNPNMWSQAYYINDTYWKGADSGAPVFLCVGGEGPPLTPAVVVNSVHCSNAVEWLKETGGLMFAVEHRYYGCHNMSACPVSSFSGPEPLKYLSSKQALADLVQFHGYATETYNLTENNKWVSFGGSYPGMLAGWFRVRYPHLVAASSASSAPVHAKVEMQEYNDWVAYAYTVESVGGSKECADAIKEGHASIGDLLNTTQGRSTLAQQFPQVVSADWLTSRENQRAFAGEGVAYFPSQGNDPACTQAACNIEKICKIMLAGDDKVQQLATVTKTQMDWLPEVLESFKDSVSEAEDFWGWQTCTEFGFYQTCDIGSKCFFTQGLDVLKDQISMCKNQFNISAETVAKNVEFSNLYYGALKPVASNIVWSNGEVDPWSTLSILKQPSALQPTLWVKGASHHAWTHESLPTDQQSVKDARMIIRKYIGSWIGI